MPSPSKILPSRHRRAITSPLSRYRDTLGESTSNSLLSSKKRARVAAISQIFFSVVPFDPPEILHPLVCVDWEFLSALGLEPQPHAQAVANPSQDAYDNRTDNKTCLISTH